MEAYEEQRIKQANKGTTIAKTNYSNNIKKCNKKNNNIENCDVTNEQNKQTQLIVENNNKIVESVKSKQNVANTVSEPLREILPPLKKLTENKQKLSTLVRRPRSVTASIFAATEAKLKNNCGSNSNNIKNTASTVGPTSSTVKIINRPQNATLKIFAPRTDDMNKGFLMFADDESGLTSK